MLKDVGTPRVHVKKYRDLNLTKDGDMFTYIRTLLAGHEVAGLFAIFTLGLFCVMVLGFAMILSHRNPIYIAAMNVWDYVFGAYLVYIVWTESTRQERWLAVSMTVCVVVMFVYKMPGLLRSFRALSKTKKA